MNKKGFAISIILYSIVFLIITILYMLLGIVRNRYIINQKLRENIIDELNEGEDYVGTTDDPWIDDSPVGGCIWGEWSVYGTQTYTTEASCNSVKPTSTDTIKYKCESFVNCYTVTCSGVCDGNNVGGTNNCMQIDNPANDCRSVFCPTGNFSLNDFTPGDPHSLYRVYERKCL